MDEIDVLINDVWYMIFWCVNLVIEKLMNIL